MDYSKFYLKNYVPADEPSEEQEKIVFPRLESRTQPEIIYINPDGEIFDPDIKDDNQVDRSEYSQRTADGSSSDINEAGENTSDKEGTSIPTTVRYPYVVKKSNKDDVNKKSFINRFCQAILILAIVVMSIVVSADFVTDGKVIAAIVNGIGQTDLVYYAVLENPKDDLTTSQVDSYAMRLKGGAGFTVKNGDKYYNVFAIYSDKNDADEYVKQNGGEILTLSTDFYKDIQGELKNFTDYPEKICNELDSVLNDLTQKKITTTQAIEKINDVKEDFKVTYDNMSNVSKSDGDDKSVTLLANASVALSALEYLCDTTVSRPNLACDIRYTVCRIIFTYCYSA